MSSAREDMPLVSVIMPSYNHEKYIEKAIRSVWHQTYENIELIVLDDGSKDNSPKIIKELEKISPIPMKVVLKENEGLCKTLNQGIDLAQGEYLGFLASDDIYCPEKTAKQISIFRDLDDSYASVYGDGLLVTENGEILKDKKISDNIRFSEQDKDVFFNMLTDNFILYIQAALFRKDHIVNIGKFDINLRFEDLDLYLRLAKHYRFYFMNEIVFYYRYNINGSLVKCITYEETMEVILKHIDFLDLEKQKEVYRYRYKKMAEFSLYWQCDIKKGLVFYFKLLKLKTFTPFYYQQMPRFLVRCMIINSFGNKAIEFINKFRNKNKGTN